MHCEFLLFRETLYQPITSYQLPAHCSREFPRTDLRAILVHNINSYTNSALNYTNTSAEQYITSLLQYSITTVFSSVVNLEITILISRISRYRLSKSCSRSCCLYQSLDLDLDLELHNLDLDLVLDCQDLDLNLVLEHNFLDLY